MMLLRRIMRVWREHLSLSEFAVLTFVWDRTYAYNKSSERIPFHHFFSVRSKDGQLLHCGLGLSRNTLKTTIARLKKDGAILTNKAHRTECVEYAINPVWRPDATRTKNWAKLGPNFGPRLGPIFGPPNNGNINMKKVTGGNSRETQALLEKARAISANTSAKRLRKKSKPGMLAIETIWRDAAGADAGLAWTKRQYSQVKRALNLLPAETNHNEFILFVVENWRDILRHYFPKMQYLTPKVDVFVSRIETFFEAYRATIDPKFAKQAKRGVVGGKQADEIDALRRKVAKQAKELDAKDRELQRARGFKPRVIQGGKVA
jgi:hypothetical protein